MTRTIPLSGIKYIQEELQKNGLYSGKIDGLRTTGTGQRSKTDEGIERALGARQSELVLKASENSFQDWTDKRRAVAYLQLLLSDDGHKPGPADGLWGQLTEAAYQDKMGKLAPAIDRGRQFVSGLSLPNPHNFPRDDTASLTRHFGRAAWPGPAGFRTKMVNIPFDARAAWDLSTRITKFQWHEDTAHIMEEVMQDIDKTYPSAQDKKDCGIFFWGGTFMPRPITGGNYASTHAYGIAIDIDPSRNQLRKTFEQSHMSHEDCRELLKIFSKHGIMNLGLYRNFDSMHFQMARRGFIPEGPVDLG